MQMMQQELDRSVLSNQMLGLSDVTFELLVLNLETEQSSATLRLTNEQYSTLSIFLNTSQALITSLERADTMDRLLMGAALLFFILVCLFIIKRRILDRGLRVMNVLVGRGGKNKKRAVLEAVTSSLTTSEAGTLDLSTALSTIATATLASVISSNLPSVFEASSTSVIATSNIDFSSITPSAHHASPVTAAPVSTDLSSSSILAELSSLSPTATSPLHEVESSTTSDLSIDLPIPATTDLSIESKTTAAPAKTEDLILSPTSLPTKINHTEGLQEAGLVKQPELLNEPEWLDTETILSQAQAENELDEALELELEKAREEFEAAEKRMVALRKKARVARDEL